MSESRREGSMNDHPSEEQLLAFAERRSGDSNAVEAHLDRCALCAEAVLILRRIEVLQQAGIPGLEKDEKDRIKERLRGRFAHGAKGDVRRLEASDGGKWAALGGLAGLTGLGFGQDAPKPLVAGFEKKESSDPDAGEDAAAPGESEEGVDASEEDSPSGEQTAQGPSDADLEALQRLIERSLDSESTERPASHEIGRGGDPPRSDEANEAWPAGWDESSPSTAASDSPPDPWGEEAEDRDQFEDPDDGDDSLLP